MTGHAMSKSLTHILRLTAPHDRIPMGIIWSRQTQYASAICSLGVALPSTQLGAVWSLERGTVFNFKSAYTLHNGRRVDVWAL